MSIRTLLRCLIGDRQAILTWAATPWMLLVGLILVLSAAFAREYDGADLLREPWHLVLPLAASLASSFVLFLLILLAGSLPRAKSDGTDAVDLVSGYPALLSLYWMTAPLAWLYAVPYERFLSPLAAMQANLCTLGLVAVWRVVLMIRVLGVLFGFAPWAAIMIVMLFADSLALFALNLIPVPILDLMGGMRLTESERLLQSTAQSILMLGGCSLPVWLVGTVIAVAVSQPRLAPRPSNVPSGPTAGVWAVAIASLAIWAVLLPLTQPLQQLRREVEELFSHGDTSAALGLMSSHDASDFPAHWQPPLGRAGPYLLSRPGNHVPRLEEIFAAMERDPPAPWVRTHYLEKLWEDINAPARRRRLGDESLTVILRKLPERPAILRELEDSGQAERAKEIRRLLGGFSEKASDRKSD